MTSRRTDDLLDELRQYLLAECFTAIDPKPMDSPKGLLLGTQKNFQFWTARLFDVQIILAAPHDPIEGAPQRFLTMWQQVIDVVEERGTVAVLITDKLSIASRRILTAKKVPFAVPGSHLFLPQLAIHFQDELLAKIPPVKRTKLSPTTQYVLKALLQCPNLPNLQSQYDEIFNVSRMTVSRIVTELEERSWLSVNKVIQKNGAGNQIELKGKAFEIWDEAKEYFPNPVVRTIRLNETVPEFERIGVRAGYTALSDYIMIADNRYPTYAIDRQNEKQYQSLLQELVCIHKSDCKMEIQVWQHPTRLPSGFGNEVDLLSIYLSFPDQQDERTEQALEELERNIKWS